MRAFLWSVAPAPTWRAGAPGALCALFAATLLATGCGGNSSNVPAKQNVPPTADAGADQDVTVGATVNFDASGSSDPEGDALKYQWTFSSRPAGSTAKFADATSKTTSAVVDVQGVYIVELQVTDSLGATGQDVMVVVAGVKNGPGNQPPTASAGPDQDAVTGQTVVQLDGTASSDPEGAALNYLWQIQSAPQGSNAKLVIDSPAQPTLTPDVDGQYVVGLQVNDGQLLSGWDTMTITASSETDIVADPNAPTGGTVGSALSSPLSITVTNAGGMPVRGVRVTFTVDSGDATITPTNGFTGADGTATTAVTFGNTEGAVSITAACATCTGTGSVSFSLNAAAGPPAAISIISTADAPASGGLATVGMAITDAYGNVITGDNATTFTLSATGNGNVSIASATTGSLPDGGGTAFERVTVTGGKALVKVSDDTAETVSYALIDSEGTGLSFPTAAYDATQKLTTTCGQTAVETFDVSGAMGPATGPATVDIDLHANTWFGSDYATVYMEAAGGDNYGNLPDTPDPQCEDSTLSFSVPLSTLQGYVSDGSVGVAIYRASGIECGSCGDYANIHLNFPVLPTTTFF